MAGLHSSGFLWLVSTLLVLLHSKNGDFAPTHHLKIGVEGNTPMLIVTSGEIDVAPDVEVATSASSDYTSTKRNTTTATFPPSSPATTPTHPTTSLSSSPVSTSSSLSPPTKWLHKTNQLKLKNKSLKSLYEKKHEKTSKEKMTLWHGKNLLATSMPPVSRKLEAKLKTTSSPAPKKVVEKESNLITTEASKKLPNIEATDNNEFKAETKHTTSLTAPPTTPTTISTYGNQTEVMKSGKIAFSTITLGKVPHQVQTVATTESSNNTEIMKKTATTTKVTPPEAATMTTTTTPTAIILTTTKTSLGRDVGSDDNKSVSPKAFEEKNDSSMRPTSTSVFPTKLTSTATPIITTDVSGGSSISSLTENPISTTLVESKNTKMSGGEYGSTTHYVTAERKESILTTTKPILAVKTKDEENATVSTKDSSTAPNTLKSYKVENADESTQHAVIKLIDLEKHEAISIDELRTKGNTQLTDGGHDGVKQTKKKQLLEKHFMVDAPGELDFETTIETSTLLSASTIEPVENDKVSSISVQQEQQHNIEKPVLSTPTLMPVHNGYLGPIIMGERTFTVMHRAGEKPKPHEHEASIESKLHDGRIVEIIAPTALLEKEMIEPTKVTKNSITTTVEPKVHHRQPEATVLSTTVFQVPEHTIGPTPKPVDVAKPSTTQGERRESKISDIQIEVYDNVAAPTKLKYADEVKDMLVEDATTKLPSLLPTTQERFTQYVVDRTEASTPDTIVDANLNFMGVGKPEPAAIEIHINVSEGIASQGEDLEFSYRQQENSDDSKSTFGFEQQSSQASKPLITLPSPQNESNNEHNDDILVVEIIDTGDNSTESQSNDSGNVKPVFTFRSDSSTDVELKDVRYMPGQSETGSPPQMADELFMADMKQNGNSEFPKKPILPPPPPRAPSIDRDSDTIFYISNTEVKVGESPPSSISDDSNHSTRREQLLRARLENQFFPANYVASTHPNTAVGQQTHPKHLYEEDIILSPVRNTADSLKIFRSQGDGAPPLDVTYVGESVIEVEQSSGAGTITTTTASATYTTSAPLPSQPSLLPTQTPDVIIQPAMLPEMSIGVPVIGELPPQIELKEIDFMPNEANQQRSGVYETENNIDIEENLSDANNDVDRLVESSIQYGGDLIDEGADAVGGFDGIEGSYPFGNMAAMRRRTKNNGAADYAHFAMHHGVNNLRKDELSVDVANARELTSDGIALNDNGTALQNGNETSTSMNITYAVAERIGGNATAFSTSDQTEEVLLLRTAKEFGSFELAFIVGILVLLTIVTLLASYVSCHIYKKIHGSGQESESSEMNLPNGTVAHCEGGDGASKGDESTTQPPTPMREDSSEFDSTNDRNCLPVTGDSNLTKPSNNSNSLNIVNEKNITDSFINKRSTDTSRRIEKEANGQSNNSVPDSYAGPNGSVTKMTLKNNHLIVETEERNDISRDARETKMHYTSDKDGVFVVEVARGADSKIIPDSPIAELTDEHLFVQQPKTNGNNNKSPIRKYEDEPAVLNNHEQVQIHQPPTELHTSNPERSLHQIEEVEEETMLSPKTETGIAVSLEKNANTGLSQSDLSSTSSADSNKRYTYGNQVLYTTEQTDFVSSSPINSNTTPTTGKTPDDDRKSENGNNCEKTPEKPNVEEGHGNEEKNVQDDEEGKSEEIVDNEVKPEEQESVKGQEVNEKHQEEEIAVEVPEEMKVTQASLDDTELQQKLCEDVETESADMVGDTIKEIELENDKEEGMSVSEVDYAVESVTIETDSTQKLVQPETKIIPNGIQQNDQVENESLAQAETDPELTFDSLMSLPDPPSNEEMTQYSDFNGIESSQLDSLPPPPPALLTDENTNMPDIVAEIKSKPCQQSVLQSINGNIEYYPNNDNLNEHESSDQSRGQGLPQLPPPSQEEINSNSKMLPNSPLTPPESPPPSPPAQYSNGVMNINEQICSASVHAVAVDVNGS